MISYIITSKISHNYEKRNVMFSFIVSLMDHLCTLYTSEHVRSSSCHKITRNISMLNMSAVYLSDRSVSNQEICNMYTIVSLSTYIKAVYI